MSIFSSPVLGVDIGHATVKVAAVLPGKRPTLLGCKELPIDPSYVSLTGFSNHQAIADTVRQAMKSAAPRAIGSVAGAYTAIPESLVFRKSIALPRLEREADMLKAARLEVSQYLPTDVDQFELDYQPLGSAVHEDPDLVNILVVAVAKSVLADYITVCRLARLPLTAIDTKPSAVARALLASQGGESTVLVDIGATETIVSLYGQGQVRVTGSLTFGGDSLKEAGSMEIDAAKLAHLGASIAEEVQHVVAFARNRTAAGQKTSKVLLAGGGSMIVGLLEAIASNVELPVEAGKPVLTVPAFCDRRFIGAIGTALYPISSIA